MALADTGRAIGKVSQLLQEHLDNRTGITTHIGRPESNDGGNNLTTPRLNLFLYEAQFDPGMKNLSLDEGQQPPLWLVLKYLLTSFDDDDKSESAVAHENLGLGIRALRELNYVMLTSITLTTGIESALIDNPEYLKITFDEANSDLISKLMQGPDDKYRFSMVFQVRPVMIAATEPPGYDLLVGVDYTETPPDVIGEEGIHLPVMPSMGPLISSVSPPTFEIEDKLTIHGSNLNISGLSVRLGEVELGVSAQSPNWLQCDVNGVLAGGTQISPGSYPLSVAQSLPGGRKRTSNLLVGELRPKLEQADPDSVAVVVGSEPNVEGNIVMQGTLLGRPEDDIYVAFYQDGEVSRMYDGPFTFSPDQTGLTLSISPDHLEQPQDPVEPGVYLIILRVNGQQAKRSPRVDFST